MSTEVAPVTASASESSVQPVLQQLRRSQARKARRSKTTSITVVTVRVAILAVLLGGWEWASRSETIDPLFFSSPGQITSYLSATFAGQEIWTHIIITMRETFYGFAIGSGLGVIAGLALVQFRFLARVAGPFLTVLNSLPRVALAPMFIIWFGLGETSKVVLAFSLVFFIVMISTESGARSVDQEYLTTFRAMGATKFQLFTNVTLPATVPGIFAGLRLGVVYALLGVVLGEMLAAEYGLGQELQRNANTFNTSGVFGTILILAVISVALNAAVVYIEAQLLSWRNEQG